MTRPGERVALIEDPVKGRFQEVLVGEVVKRKAIANEELPLQEFRPNGMTVTLRDEKTVLTGDPVTWTFQEVAVEAGEEMERSKVIATEELPLQEFTPNGAIVTLQGARAVEEPVK